MHGTPVKYFFSPSWTAVFLLIFFMRIMRYLICGDSQRQIESRPQQKALAHQALSQISWRVKQPLQPFSAALQRCSTAALQRS
jgi:hypothetical protein